MVRWLATLANHTYSTVGMHQPQDAGYKGQKGVFPNNNKKQKYCGKRPWQYSEGEQERGNCERKWRGGGGGRGRKDTWNDNNGRRSSEGRRDNSSDRK